MREREDHAGCLPVSTVLNRRNQDLSIAHFEHVLFYLRAHQGKLTPDNCRSQLPE